MTLRALDTDALTTHWKNVSNGGVEGKFGDKEMVSIGAGNGYLEH
jgi:hypothetical protein